LQLRLLFSRTLSLFNTLRRSAFFYLVLVYALTGLGAGLFIPYFNIYFVQHLNASPALFGLIDGGANTITALLTLTAPRLAKSIGKINTITLTRLASIPLLLIVGLTGILPLAALVYLFRQGAMEMSAGILQVFSMESVSDRHRGLANSSYQSAFQVPWALAAPIGGLIIVNFGYPPIFLLGAFFYVLTIIILWAKFGSRKQARSDEATQQQTVHL
jgi:predicted MFS family arabinose efflux permease